MCAPVSVEIELQCFTSKMNLLTDAGAVAWPSVADLIRSHLDRRKVLSFHSGLSGKCSKEEQSHSEAKAEEQSRNHTDPRFVEESNT